MAGGATHSLPPHRCREGARARSDPRARLLRIAVGRCQGEWGPREVMRGQAERRRRIVGRISGDAAPGQRCRAARIDARLPVERRVHGQQPGRSVLQARRLSRRRADPPFPDDHAIDRRRRQPRTFRNRARALQRLDRRVPLRQGGISVRPERAFRGRRGSPRLRVHLCQQQPRADRDAVQDGADLAAGLWAECLGCHAAGQRGVRRGQQRCRTACTQPPPADRQPRRVPDGSELGGAAQRRGRAIAGGADQAVRAAAVLRRRLADACRHVCRCRLGYLGRGFRDSPPADAARRALRQGRAEKCGDIPGLAAGIGSQRRLPVDGPGLVRADRRLRRGLHLCLLRGRRSLPAQLGSRLARLGARARFLASRRQGRVDAAAAPQGRRHREPLAVHPRMARDGTARPRDAERAVQASRRLVSDKISTSDKNPMSDKKTVLLVSLFHPELVRGGAQQVCYELFEGLRDDPEYRPVLLASIDATYPALYKSGARITGFDERPDEFLFLSRDYDHWWHRTSDPLLVESYTEFLEQIRPDVVHFHHFLTYGVELISLTRRVLPEARLVMTFHEFLAICNANGHMVRRFDNSLCRTASQVRCHQCFPERSPEDFFVRKLWLQSHLGAIDAFTCPSRFMLDHYADWGLARDRLFHVTNGQRDYATADDQPVQARQEARETYNRFGFFGQIIDAKGVHIILRAVALLRAEGFTDFTVEINGGNLNYASPEVRAEIEEFIEAEKERPTGERLVSFNGSYATRELRSRMARIDWCLVPSMWWEAFALVISEAWMFKKPVICSNVGAMADRVRDEKDGLQFEMGDPAGLARTIKRAASEPGLWKRLAGALPVPPARADMVDW